MLFNIMNKSHITHRDICKYLKRTKNPVILDAGAADGAGTTIQGETLVIRFNHKK